MQPIHELLNRIKWDEAFGRAEFMIAYHDRLRSSMIKVPLTDISFDQDDHFDFEMIDDMGEAHTVPLHRIREVYRNGQLIWRREPPAGEP